MSDTKELNWQVGIHSKNCASWLAGGKCDCIQPKTAEQLAQLRAELDTKLVEWMATEKEAEEFHEKYYSLKQKNARLRAELDEEKLLRGMAEKSGLELFKKNRNLTDKLNKAYGLIGSVLAWLAAFQEKNRDKAVHKKYLELAEFTAAHKEQP